METEFTVCEDKKKINKNINNQDILLLSYLSSLLFYGTYGARYHHIIHYTVRMSILQNVYDLIMKILKSGESNKHHIKRHPKISGYTYKNCQFCQVCFQLSSFVQDHLKTFRTEKEHHCEYECNNVGDKDKIMYLTIGRYAADLVVLYGKACNLENISYY